MCKKGRKTAVRFGTAVQGLFGAFGGTGAVGCPALEGVTLDRAEDALTQAGHGLFEVFEQVFDLLPLGVAVGRAGVVHDGQRVPGSERADVILGRIEQRADQGDARAVEEGHGLEARNASFVKQGQHVGLDHVVKVVAERDLFAARGERGLVQRAAAHLGTQRAGVFLLPDIEDNLLDLGRDADVFHAQLVAQRLYRREVHLLITHLERNSDDLELLGVKGAQFGQRDQQRKRVLAAGYADRDTVAVLDHVVMVHRTADVREHFLHGLVSKILWFGG